MACGWPRWRPVWRVGGGGPQRWCWRWRCCWAPWVMHWAAGRSSTCWPRRCWLCWSGIWASTRCCWRPCCAGWAAAAQALVPTAVPARPRRVPCWRAHCGAHCWPCGSAAASGPAGRQAIGCRHARPPAGPVWTLARAVPRWTRCGWGLAPTGCWPAPHCRPHAWRRCCMPRPPCWPWVRWCRCTAVAWCWITAPVGTAPSSARWQCTDGWPPCWGRPLRSAAWRCPMWPVWRLCVLPPGVARARRTGSTFGH